LGFFIDIILPVAL